MDFEKLGSFYLGKHFNLEQKSLLDRLVMYDARDLTTHAVCVGMTGSGKTGLCIDLLEEAAIDQVPAIIIDPKGDMTNLLLSFPELRGQDIRPWVNIDDARRKGLSADEFAEQQASLWRQGLSSWGQGLERISLLRDSVEHLVFTPGSSAGIPISILSSFAPPDLSWATHSEELREKIQGTVAGLLGLVGVDADPVRSRESILLSSLFEHFWQNHLSLDLAGLIMAIQNPPITKLGVFDLDTFFPSKDRFDLAMSLNAILASPAFKDWIEGHPLDIDGFLANPAGKPRHSIFYIAHLSDSERMFFVTILLNEVLSWIRSQPGTTSLRAVLYMDEIFGYFPPVANPPSKKPMLSLLKQARAFGLGVVLASQNPVDLDYKGLTNTGTWFVGRLQTERDKMRVLDGLEGIGGEGGQTLKREDLDRIISGLDSRVFLMHNIHDEGPTLFQTRWAMSYLRGPLTKAQIREIQPPLQVPEVSSFQPVSAPEPPPELRGTSGLNPIPPVLPPELQSVYLPVRLNAESAILKLQQGPGADTRVEKEQLVYYPGLVGLAKVHLVDRKSDIDELRKVARLVEVPRGTGFVRWADSANVQLDIEEIQRHPEPTAVFYDLPDSMDEVREIKALERDFADYLYHSEQLSLSYNPATGLTSRPRETDRDFRLRLRIEAREKRDQEVDALNKKYQKQVERLQSQLDKAELAHSKKEATANARKTETLVSVGESILGMFMGRRATRAASTGFSKYRMSASARMAAAEALQKVDSLKGEISSLEEELRQQATAIIARWEESIDVVETQVVKPRRTDVDVLLVGIAWIPYWELHYLDATGVGRTEAIPAFLQ